MNRLFLLGLFLISGFSWADSEADKRAAVKKLLELTDAESMVNVVYEQMEQMVASTQSQLGLKGEELAMFNEYYKQVIELTRTEMNWATLEGPITDIYVKNFTQKELDDIIAFYNSDSGQSMVKKMPGITRESMQLSQGVMASLMPKIQQLSLKFQQELRNKRASTPVMP
jgi:hypothetical protein